MINIENENQFKQLVAEGVTLVDFYATWCGPCRMLAPIIEEIEEEYSDRVSVAKVDVDECGEIAAKYGINAIPALLVFKNKDLVETSVGFMAKDGIKELLDGVLSK